MGESCQHIRDHHDIFCLDVNFFHHPDQVSALFSSSVDHSYKHSPKEEIPT